MKRADEQFMNQVALPILPAHLRVPRLQQCDWMDLKAQVHAESGGRCFYCDFDTRPWSVCDHLTPIARGGTNDRSNLVTSCDPCNLSKGMLTLDEFNAKRAALRAA